MYARAYKNQREEVKKRTAGAAAAGFSVSAGTSPSALTIKDRLLLLEDLTCETTRVADNLFAMVDAKDMFKRE